MLAPATTLKASILSLKPTMDKVAGITALVGKIADYMNNLQGGSLGTVGIFMLNNNLMIAGLTSLMPVSDNSWIAPFTLAFQNACLAATILEGTVTNPVWLGSTVDVNTLPSGAATITTIPTAVADLTAKLMTAPADSTAPLALAQGINEATLDFIFTCIGLGVAPTFIPIPVPVNAQ